MKIVRKFQNALRMAENLAPLSLRSPNEPTGGLARLPLPLGLALSTWLGFSLVALTNAIAIAARLPLPRAGQWLRIQHHFYDAAGIFGIGLIFSVVLFVAAQIVSGKLLATQSRRARLLVALFASAALSSQIVLQLVGHELHRASLMHLQGNAERPLFFFLTALAAFLPPILYLSSWIATQKPRIRWIPLALGVALLLSNHFLLRDDYPGAHGFLAWLGALLSGPPLLSLLEPFLCALLVDKKRRLALLAPLLFAALGLALRPSNAVRIELFREPGALSAWIFSQFVWPIPGPIPQSVPQSLAQHPFWRPRRGLAPIAPTETKQSTSPVVVLLTIDAVRADVIEDPQWEARLPTFAKLKREGAYFPRAIAPGSQTAVSLSSLFSSKYFSQLVWRDFGKGSTRFAYPAADPALRFPELLSRASIKTGTYCSITFLSNEYGVIRGFDDQTIVTQGREHAPIEDVMAPLLKRLVETRDEPLFLYAHLTEPHAPYDRGGTRGSSFERYLSEIAVVDGHLDRLLEFFKQRFPDRGYLIITSDHGEAFGEHFTYKHTKTLYDELLRVPLFVHGRGLQRGVVNEPAGLIDLAPTIADLFHLPIPAEWMGESLVPLLHGSAKHLQRPLLAEGRLRRALYWNGLKVIDDPRRKVVELFDIERDPNELDNLYEKDPQRAKEALFALRSFFLTHQAAEEGYVPPYRP